MPNLKQSPTAWFFVVYRRRRERQVVMQRLLDKIAATMMQRIEPPCASIRDPAA
jgi:hypothetical protein